MNINENEFFRQATLAICGHLELEDALCASMQLIARHIPGDSLYLELYDWDFGVMRAVASATVESGRRIDVVVPMPKAGIEQASQVGSFDVIIVNDSESNPVAHAMNEAFGQEGASCLVLPLVIQDQPLGILVLVRTSGNPYTADHARLLSLLNEPFALALTNSLRHDEVLRLKELLANDNRFLHRELRSLSGDRIVGADFGLQTVMELVQQVARLDSPVLLLGETGVGKDVIANAIHHSSARHDGPFIKVNSGAIPDSLVDSELFGHEKGAFTGALATKRGRFERAHGGTLFLDEIGELPLAAQVRLLRVVQSGELERVGGTGPLKVDVRLISATHRDLGAMVRKERFREDLWFRLNVFPILIPPLRQRREDIRALAHHFLEAKSRELKLGDPPDLAPGAVDQLMGYDWPGNVRELENVVERALILHRDGPMTFDVLVGQPSGPDAPPATSQPHPAETLDAVMARHIERVLKTTHGKIHGPGGAAELLGIKPNTLRARMDKLSIPFRRQKRR